MAISAITLSYPLAQDAAICSLLGSRRNSACSDASTATGSCASEAVEVTEEDDFSCAALQNLREVSHLANGLYPQFFMEYP